MYLELVYMIKRELIIATGLVLITAVILASLLALNRGQSVDTTTSPATTTPLTTGITETTTTTQGKVFEDMYVSLVIEQLQCQPPKAPVYFRFTPFPNETITKVSVAGDFTGWAPSTCPGLRMEHG